MTPVWVTLTVAAAAALAAVVSAIIAALSARTTKTKELEAGRVRDLESRISEKKYDTYKPAIDVFGRMLDKDGRENLDLKEVNKKILDFRTWITIYGSDGAVRSFNNFMQASFNSAPPTILLRLFSDFVLEARRDIGNPDTDLTVNDVLASRIKDLYSGSDLGNIQDSIEDLSESYGWTPPWLKH
ncbi:hypothetical protein HDA32_006000 [Spinactinospora alkalitolerans]|uniref:Uncharacterized protein n=1 Tax=Spinactinospora alkalitolerans TaxID=687207 RepID=A0A852UA85_9ACTN|nr:hypothetical protein [Spinactinospora alkalitolerans]NYE50880.1 hypothetical protein [Spinactinospora alkalitolerans]